MHYVYILASLKHPAKCYIGTTTDLENRLAQHNASTEGYSKQYAPWRIETYVAFSSAELAWPFEQYLKSGSGHAFLKRRFLPKLAEPSRVM